MSAGLFERGLCLPSGSSLSQSELERVVESIVEVPRLQARGALESNAASWSAPDR